MLAIIGSMGGRDADVHEIEQHPPIRQDGNNIHIDYVDMKNISVDYEITVPTDTAVRTHSGWATRLFEGTHGNVETQTGSGDVKARESDRQIQLQTGSGNIRAPKPLAQ